MTVKGIRELARELALSVGKVHALLASGVLPSKGPGGYDVEASRRALDALADSAAAAIESLGSPTAEARPAALPEASGRVEPPAIAELSTAASSPRTSAGDVDEDDLERFDPLAIAEESVRRAQSLLASAQPHEVPRVLESIKKALEEYRKTDAGELAIARKRGTVIPVDDARGVAGKISRLFVSALERVEAKLASQVELWVYDQELRALEPTARRRSVQEWFAGHTSIVRRLTAAEIDRMIQEEGAVDE